MNIISKLAHDLRLTVILPYYRIALSKGEKVLDYGCGDGHVGLRIAKVTGCKIYGCDVLDFAEGKLPFKIIRHNKVDHPEKFFDAVMINHVLHHTPRKEHKEIVKEAVRLGKRVCIMEDDPSLISLAADKFFNAISHKGIKTPLTQQPVKKWTRLFNSIGLSYKFIEVKKWYYPFKHYFFVIDS
ncbi:MAG: class I SAM-dependent methyltransferase [Nanoarchaeota archaeon]